MSEHDPVGYMSVEEYLQFETSSAVRHEYIRGAVFAMSGGTQAHNVICTNLTAALHGFLKGSGCRVFSASMKVHVKAAECIYYPDVMTTCEPFESKSVFVSSPRLIIEVLSPSTAATDCREKYGAYTQIPSLQQYVLIYQNRLRIDVYERDKANHWQRISLRKGDKLELNALASRKLALPISEVYEGMDEPPHIEEPTAEYFPFDGDPEAERN